MKRNALRGVRPDPIHSRPERRSALRRGFTLVEMLVAMALTLIMVYAIAEFYAYVGDTVRDGRAMIEMGGQLRAASQRLKRDLDSITVRVVPWTDDGNNTGFFEYYEGPQSDKFPDGATAITADGNSNGVYDYLEANATNMLSDGDDYVAFTITSGAEPFQGRHASATNGIASSRQAEVIWWTGFKDTNGDGDYDADEPRFLFRRQLLILPNPGQIGTTSYGTAAEALTYLAEDFWQNNDVSASVRRQADGTYRIYSNSLSDLTRRENRFAHVFTGNVGFPGHPELQAGTIAARYVLTTAVGEDIMLSNLLGFDVRAYDPTAQLLGDTSAASSAALSLAPGDLEYRNAATAGNAILGYGAYVDLFYNRSENTGKTTVFSGAPATNSGLDTLPGATYDTWSLSYERHAPGNGVALNGIDDNNADGVDDPSERVTAPPYAAPLRGIQVKIRMYDPSSRQVRQSTVVADFIGE